MPELPLSSDYAAWLGEVKERVQAARTGAARAVNRELILLYWDIGEGIVAKQAELGWGDGVVDQLARDLRDAFPANRGFSRQNLWRMRQLYLAYSSPEFLSQAVRVLEEETDEQDAHPRLAAPETSRRDILSQAVRQWVAEVPWGHHANVLAKITDPAERVYYLRTTSRLGWTRAVLLNQVKADAYGRSLAESKSHNFPLALPGHLAEQAEETLKSSYNLEFLGIGRAVKERELEDRLTEQLKDFILELGYGFCFVGRQYRLVLEEKEYFIDLLFYHRFLKCLVAIELKVGEFEPEYAGKMDFYLNLLNEKERAPDDNPSIGIILCAEKNDVEVEFALKTKGNPIGVAGYQLKTRLPADLKGKLPTAGELKKALRLGSRNKSTN